MSIIIHFMYGYCDGEEHNDYTIMGTLSPPLHDIIIMSEIYVLVWMYNSKLLNFL